MECLPFLTKRQKLCDKGRARIFENLHLFTFLRAHPAERFFALDCAASAQSRANPFGRSGGVGRDHFQPHNRQRFASRNFAKPHCSACRTGSRQSGEFLNQSIPRNLRKRRLLRQSDLYRGFESTPLRHAVWVAEKSGCLLSKIAGNRRNSSTLALKLDRRKCRSQSRRPAFATFSLKGRRAVRFRRLH
jgi:hypothetical protein